jgi:peptidoglycan/LPS O-acetylase OafA/YrhL
MAAANSTAHSSGISKALASARIPSLDGLRGISLLLVLYVHLAGCKGAYPYNAVLVTGDIGYLAVRDFFVISGFIITTLLLQEQDRTGRVSFKEFYIRRVYRIFPVFYTFIIGGAVLTWLGVLATPLSDFVKASTCVADLFRMHWNLGHFWSLSVEEKFYFLWPVPLVVCGRRRAWYYCLAVMVLAPVLHVVSFRLHNNELAKVFLSLNGISTGCFLALIRPALQRNTLHMRALKSRWFVLVIIAMFLLNRWSGHLSYVCYALTSICLALLVDRVTQFPNGLASILNWKPVVFLGGTSYSIYVWQQIFLNRAEHQVFNTFPLNIVLALLCGFVTHFLVERPFMRLRGNQLRKAREQAQLAVGRVPAFAE